MKNKKLLPLAIVLGGAFVTSQQSVFAVEGSPAETVDCSVPSAKECIKVNVLGRRTVVHYGKAKEKEQETTIE